MHYEIYSVGTHWLWRFADGAKEIFAAPKPLTHAQCIRAVQVLRMTVKAPILVVV